MTYNYDHEFESLRQRVAVLEEKLAFIDHIKEFFRLDLIADLTDEAKRVAKVLADEAHVEEPRPEDQE